MDLSTVLSKIDLHQYGTVKEFLQDVDLIWQNALEYNPDRDPSGTRSEDNTAVGTRQLHNARPNVYVGSL